MSLDGQIPCPDCFGLEADCMTCDGDGVVTQICDMSGPLVDQLGNDLLPQLNDDDTGE